MARFFSTLEPAVPDGHRDGRPDADRGVLHDQAGELEHHLGERVEPVEHHLLRPPAHLRQADPEQDRPEDDLQHLVLDGRVEHAVRDDVVEEVAEGLRLLRELLALLGRRRPG